MRPSLCMAFEATGPYNAIGKIAMAQVEAALAAGWNVSVVAKRLSETLQGRVEWLKLYVPPRGFALQWLTARRLIRRAMGDPSRFDVIHGHQPQVADLCHVFQCHFLTRSAYARGCLFDGAGVRRAVDALQKRAVLAAEDGHYGHWNPSTHMIFVSDLIRAEFARLYGVPPSWEVLENAGPSPDAVTQAERDSARRSLGVEANGRTVIGFLGGLTERKGGRQLLDAAASDDGLFILMGGSRSEGFADPRLKGRLSAVGMVQNIRQFYAACDVFAVPSVFDPCPYVVVEAASRGIPVIATPGVGNAATLERTGAGLIWQPGQFLGATAREIMERRPDFVSAGLRWAGEQTLDKFCDRTLDAYDRSLRKRGKPTRGTEALPCPR